MLRRRPRLALVVCRQALLSIGLGMLALGAGCKKDTIAVKKPAIKALAPKTAECAACSMVVREQPAPRGQLVHRDGNRRFFCSLADMLQYLRAPSKHGKPKAIFVETSDPAATDPKKTTKAPRPWIAADKAHYVVGVPREGIMGKPALAYDKRADAERIAKAHNAKVVAWPDLSAILLNRK